MRFGLRGGQTFFCRGVLLVKSIINEPIVFI